MFPMSFLFVCKANMKLRHSGEPQVSHREAESERGGESRTRRPDAEMKAEGCRWRKGVISLEEEEECVCSEDRGGRMIY